MCHIHVRNIIIAKPLTIQIDGQDNPSYIKVLFYILFQKLILLKFPSNQFKPHATIYNITGCH